MNTCAIKRVRAPISTSAPITQYGPIWASSWMRAEEYTTALPWIAIA